MYKIVSEGRLLAICEEPRYVRKKESTGAWIQTDSENAEAIAVKGQLYGFDNHEVEGRPTANIIPIDGLEYVFDNYVQDVDYKTAIAALEDAMCDIDAEG